MKISSQGTEVYSRSNIPSTSGTKVVQSIENNKGTDLKVKQGNTAMATIETTKTQEESKESISKEQLEKAVTVMNDFLEVQHKSSKFVFHEGLDKYYVRLVDSKTEEVIKEIPPERLLDAFYEMQKLSGILVDEKI